MQIKIAFIAALMSSTAFASGFPVVNGHGFDWLKPNTSTCRRITPQDVKKFKPCEFLDKGGAFGLASPYHQCKASARSEWLIYETRAKCQEAWETMQANAP